MFSCKKAHIVIIFERADSALGTCPVKEFSARSLCKPGMEVEKKRYHEQGDLIGMSFTRDGFSKKPHSFNRVGRADISQGIVPVSPFLSRDLCQNILYDCCQTETREAWALSHAKLPGSPQQISKVYVDAWGHAARQLVFITKHKIHKT